MIKHPTSVVLNLLEEEFDEFNGGAQNSNYLMKNHVDYIKFEQDKHTLEKSYQSLEHDMFVWIYQEKLDIHSWSLKYELKKYELSKFLYDKINCYSAKMTIPNNLLLHWHALVNQINNNLERVKIKMFNENLISYPTYNFIEYINNFSFKPSKVHSLSDMTWKILFNEWYKIMQSEVYSIIPLDYFLLLIQNNINMEKIVQSKQAFRNKINYLISQWQQFPEYQMKLNEFLKANMDIKLKWGDVQINYWKNCCQKVFQHHNNFYKTLWEAERYLIDFSQKCLYQINSIKLTDDPKTPFSLEIYRQTKYKITLLFLKKLTQLHIIYNDQNKMMRIMVIMCYLFQEFLTRLEQNQNNNPSIASRTNNQNHTIILKLALNYLIEYFIEDYFEALLGINMANYNLKNQILNYKQKELEILIKNVLNILQDNNYSLWLHNKYQMLRKDYIILDDIEKSLYRFYIGNKQQTDLLIEDKVLCYEKIIEKIKFSYREILSQNLPKLACLLNVSDRKILEENLELVYNKIFVDTVEKVTNSLQDFTLIKPPEYKKIEKNTFNLQVVVYKSSFRTVEAFMTMKNKSSTIEQADEIKEKYEVLSFSEKIFLVELEIGISQIIRLKQLGFILILNAIKQLVRFTQNENSAKNDMIDVWVKEIVNQPNITDVTKLINTEAKRIAFKYHPDKCKIKDNSTFEVVMKNMFQDFQREVSEWREIVSGDKNINLMYEPDNKQMLYKIATIESIIKLYLVNRNEFDELANVANINREQAEKNYQYSKNTAQRLQTQEQCVHKIENEQKRREELQKENEILRKQLSELKMNTTQTSSLHANWTNSIYKYFSM